MKRRKGMEGKKDFRQRIHSGAVTRQDVRRLLAELACGKVNDCVRLALEEEPNLEALDLSLISEVRRNEKGTVEVKLIDRLRVLEQLEKVTEAENGKLESFVQAIRDGDGA